MKYKLIYNLLIAALLLIPLGCGVSSCKISYKLNGSAINYDLYKTINISEFPIRAALVYHPLQQEFQNQLMDAVTRQTRLNIVDGNADAEISGEITGYSLSPQSVGVDAYATEYKIHRQYQSVKQCRPEFLGLPAILLISPSHRRAG